VIPRASLATGGYLFSSLGRHRHPGRPHHAIVGLEARGQLAHDRAPRDSLSLLDEHGLVQPRIERLALETGTGTQTDFLRAEADLHRARAALVQAEYGELLAQLELANATGDLSMDWLYRTLETTP